MIVVIAAERICVFFPFANMENGKLNADLLRKIDGIKISAILFLFKITQALRTNICLVRVLVKNSSRALRGNL